MFGLPTTLRQFALAAGLIVLLSPGKFASAQELQQNGKRVVAGRQQDATPKDEFAPQDPEISARVVRLIEQLGTGSFSERQSATRELLGIGMAASAELQKATSTGSKEVRERAGQVIVAIRDAEFRRRIDRLADSVTPAAAESLPEWDRFQELAAARSADSSTELADADLIRVFLRIQQAEQALFALRLFNPQGLPDALEQRSSELVRLFDDRSDKPFPAESYAAILLLASNPATRLPRATSTNISSALADERLEKLIRDGQHKDLFRSLISRWIERPGIATERPLLFAVRHELAAGRVVARRVIQSRSNRPDMIMAMLALGRLGDKTDIELLESQMTVETVLWPLRNQPVVRNLPDGPIRDTNYSVQTRDIALVVATHLRGRPPTDLGLKVELSEETVFAVESLGFESAESRAAAFAAYRAAFPK